MTPVVATRTTEAPTSAIERAYDELLSRWWHGASEESALQAAHELGREALRLGFGPLDVVAVHNRLIVRHTKGQLAASAAEAAGNLLVECLTPFEMVHRGYRTASARLQLSENRYRDLFENAHDAIFTTDLSGRITSINRAGEELSGYTREQALTLTLADLIAGKDAKQVLSRRRARSGYRRRHELEIVTRDGRRVPVEVTTRKVYEGGRVVGLQGIARDVTNRRSAEAALRHQNSRLEEMARRIAQGLHDEAGQLLASVYLRVAEIASELPPRDRERVEELRSLLDQVDDQIRRLAHELRPSVLDQLGLLPACQLLADGVSKRAGLRITVEGSTLGRLPVDVETNLYRVVQEALTNVMRHARARHATVRLERVGRRLHGVIRDDGAGFDRSANPHRPGGPGLGLVGMRERITALGGRLDVTSEPGTGTSIEFDIRVEA